MGTWGVCEGCSCISNEERAHGLGNEFPAMCVLHIMQVYIRLAKKSLNQFRHIVHCHCQT